MSNTQIRALSNNKIAGVAVIECIASLLSWIIYIKADKLGNLYFVIYTKY